MSEIDSKALWNLSTLPRRHLAGLVVVRAAVVLIGPLVLGFAIGPHPDIPRRFLELINYVYRDDHLRNSELTSKLEPAFLAAALAA